MKKKKEKKNKLQEWKHNSMTVHQQYVTSLKLHKNCSHLTHSDTFDVCFVPF